MFPKRTHISLCILLGVIFFLLHSPVHAAVQTISYAGSIQNTNSTPISGAVIEMVGDATINTLSAADGSFTLSGLPEGETFSIEIIASGYVDLYSRNFNSVTNLTGAAYKVHTLSQISSWGVVSGKTDIVGRVTDSSNNNLSGAVVSCTSTLHNPCTYTIEYGTPPSNATATTSNGNFYILNVDGGDTVTVNAALAGWVFTPITFVTYADSESESKIVGSPATAPGAPTIGTATPGNDQATVSFTPPASDGGSPITGYTVTSNPAGGVDANAGTTSTTHTVTKLTNGTSYTFTVTATNEIGTSLPSGPSNAVTPGIVPGAPTKVTATAGNGQATVSFKLPASAWNPITGCTVTSKPGGITAYGVGSPITVKDLTNGTAYTFTVTAENAIGTGPASKPSNKVTPIGVPGSPTGVTAKAGNADATVSFKAPASNGGSPITSYIVIPYIGAAAGKTTSGAHSPITVKGLTNGTAYTFTVTAKNKIGTGPASSASIPVTPTK
jgi:hypothetical protein